MNRLVDAHLQVYRDWIVQKRSRVENSSRNGELANWVICAVDTLDDWNKLLLLLQTTFIDIKVRESIKLFFIIIVHWRIEIFIIATINTYKKLSLKVYSITYIIKFPSFIALGINRRIVAVSRLKTCIVKSTYCIWLTGGYDSVSVSCSQSLYCSHTYHTWHVKCYFSTIKKPIPLDIWISQS